MLIRYGYDITVTCPQPTPMVIMLTPRPERSGDVRSSDVVTTSPETPTTTYLDLFGNVCRRFIAPTGDLQIWGDGTLEGSGAHDPVFSDAQELPVGELPDDCLVYLMGSRYCETDRLSQIAWDRFGNIAPGWGRVQAICDFVHHTSRSAIRMHAQRVQRWKVMRSGSAYVATMLISPSPSAAA